jgi:WD40 repeat protein/serine/threonine protein kinase
VDLHPGHPDQPTPPGADWRPGAVVLGLYEVQPVVEGGRQLDAHRGGMGLVYRVRHLAWHVDLAVKVPRPELFRREGEKARFQDEAENWVRLGLHPHVVACHYVRRLGEVPCVFADYVSGGSLAAWLADGRLYRDGPSAALAKILDVAIQVAWGLVHAHREGFVHQDVKPANVLVEADGLARVADFGLAQARASASGADASAERGHTVVVPGVGAMTYLYASPEQLAGEPLTQASDVWSWAVSILELFCGGASWGVGAVAPVALANRRGEHGPVPLPAAVADLLERCLELDPDARPRDLDDVAGALRTLYAETVGAPYPRTNPERATLLADALSNHALSLLDLGREDEAERAWAAALRADPQHPHASFNRGLHHWRAGRLGGDELAQRLEQVRVSHPGAWLDAYLLGRVQLERGDAVAARLALTSAHLLAPDEPEIGFALEDLDELQRSPDRGSIPAPWSYARPASADTLTDAARAAAEARSRALELAAGGRFHEAGATLEAARRIPGWRREPELVAAWRTLGRRGLRRSLADAWAAGTLEAQAGSVATVAVSFDGRQVVTAGGDERALRLYDVATGACVRVLGGGRIAVDAAAVSADGRICLSRGDELAARVWDLASGDCVRVLGGHTEPVTAVALTPDGRHALSGAADGTLRLWAVGSGACLRALAGGEADSRSVGLTADGRLAVSAGERLLVWDLAAGTLLRTLEGDDASPPTQVALTPLGSVAVSGHADGSLRWWNASSGDLLGARRAFGEAVRAVAVSPDGGLALSDGHAGEVVLWERSTGTRLRTFSGDAGPVSAVAIGSNACLVVAGGDDGSVRMWELDWRYEFLDAVDWYFAAGPHAVSFLRAHTPPFSDDLSQASWSERDFAGFLRHLEDVGYGRLRPEGVRAWLERLAGR